MAEQRPTIQFQDVNYDSYLYDTEDQKYYKRTKSAIHFADSFAIDKFGRLRVSSPQLQYDATLNQGISSLAFDTSTSSSATVTHDTNKKAAILTTSTTLNSTAILQTRRYIKYIPGISPLIFQTGNFKGTTTSNRKRLGQFDEYNGYFWEIDGSTVSVCVRSSITGSVSDANKVSQSSWNYDNFSGDNGTTNPSGLSLDFSRQIIFYITYQWLGSGTVEFGISRRGKLYPAHRFHFSGEPGITTMYSQSATLPLRYEITNLGAESATMEVTCMSVLSEGVRATTGIPRSGGMNYTARTITGQAPTASAVNVPIMSVRKKTASAFVPILIDDINVYLASNDIVLVKVIFNPTLTGATWSVDPGGVSQIDIAATSYTGGIEVHQQYLTGSAGESSLELSDVFQNTYIEHLGCSIGSTTSDTITISVTSISTGSTVYGCFNLKELVN